MINEWTLDRVHDVMKTHSNPSTLDGFVRKSYVGKAAANLQVKEGAREFIARITTNERDRDNEVVDPKGVKFHTFRKNPVILWAHNYTDPPIGRALWIKPWTENRVTRGHISKGVLARPPANATGPTKADEIFSLMQQGILNTVSIGFIPIKGHEPTPEDIKENPKLRGVSWVHDEAVMLEYSIVNVPANPDATIEAVSKGLIDISMPLQQDLGIYMPPNVPTPTAKKAVPYLETPHDGIDAGWSLTEEKRDATLDDLAVMAAWIDSDMPESRNSYKLFHHRQDSGYPLVYLGLTQAMSALQTFATAIPDTDRKDVWRHLARHYSEFGKDAPEFIANPPKFAVGSFEVSSLPTKEVVAVETPITIREISASEIIDAAEVLTVDQVTKEAKDVYEVDVLGRV